MTTMSGQAGIGFRLKDVDVWKGGLQEFGAIRIDGLISPSELASMRQEGERAIECPMDYGYPLGECRRSIISELPEGFSATIDLMDRGPLGELSRRVCGDEERQGDLIVWSWESIPNPTAVYCVPHFDRRHQLKIVVYLTDVSSRGDGAFCCIPGSHHDGSRAWISEWRKALDMPRASDQVVKEAAAATDEESHAYRSIACHSVSSQVTEGSTVEFLGPSGTVVVFDTNVVHWGGLVGDGAKRVTARRHCFWPAW